MRSVSRFHFTDLAVSAVFVVLAVRASLLGPWWSGPLLVALAVTVCLWPTRPVPGRRRAITETRR